MPSSWDTPDVVVPAYFLSMGTGPIWWWIFPQPIGPMPMPMAVAILWVVVCGAMFLYMLRQSSRPWQAVLAGLLMSLGVAVVLAPRA